jgi:predicted lysophospholipase L1 biosynthesis ABC-type transport system permease subunit
MFQSEKHEQITKLLQRLKRDYPTMMSVDIAELILRELEEVE